MDNEGRPFIIPEKLAGIFLDLDPECTSLSTLHPFSELTVQAPSLEESEKIHKCTTHHATNREANVSRPTAAMEILWDRIGGTRQEWEVEKSHRRSLPSSSKSPLWRVELPLPHTPPSSLQPRVQETVQSSHSYLSLAQLTGQTSISAQKTSADTPAAASTLAWWSNTWIHAVWAARRQLPSEDS